MSEETRCGFVALIGPPNAGKSTLLNALVGTKVSIVSPKAQTTRSRITGIALHKNAQIVFIDTPGMFRASERFDKAMVRVAEDGMHEADAVILLLDISKKGAVREAKSFINNVLEQLAAGRPLYLALNKIDKVTHAELIKMVAELSSVHDFAQIYLISALKSDGIGKILDDLAKILPKSPFHYPEDQISDLPDRLLASEITREKLFRRLHDELPYGLAVETESFEVGDKGVKISQAIFVARDSHKGIVLGKGGQGIKHTGQSAREELEELFGCRVHLNLFVKVNPKWRDDPEFYKLWGLEG